MKSLFISRWRIVEMEQWYQEFVDLVSPSHITFNRGGRGELHFGAVDLTLDWRADAGGSRVDFSLEGFDEGDEVLAEAGRGSSSTNRSCALIPKITHKDRGIVW